jgi:hypothetical protein
MGLIRGLGLPSGPARKRASGLARPLCRSEKGTPLTAGARSRAGSTPYASPLRQFKRVGHETTEQRTPRRPKGEGRRGAQRVLYRTAGRARP